MQIEQVKDAGTLDEMRAEIFRLQMYDPMVRQVTDMANFRGLSAEDRYTALAYYALRERALYQKVIFDNAMTRPMSPLVLTANAEVRGCATAKGQSDERTL